MQVIDQPITNNLIIEDCAMPKLEAGQAFIEGKICTLVQGPTPAENYYEEVGSGNFVAYAVKPEFKIDSVAAYDFVMGLMLQEEAEIASVETSADILVAKAKIANAEKLRKKHYQKLAWLELRFKAEMGMFAKTQFKGTAKTFRSILGAVSLTQAGGKVAVIKDKADKALAWAKRFCMDAVKTTEEFQISGVNDEIKSTIRLIVDPESDPELVKNTLEIIASDGEKSGEEMTELVTMLKEAFFWEPIRDNVAIKTGVAKPGK